MSSAIAFSTGQTFMFNNSVERHVFRSIRPVEFGKPELVLNYSPRNGPIIAREINGLNDLVRPSKSNHLLFVFNVMESPFTPQLVAKQYLLLNGYSFLENEVSEGAVGILIRRERKEFFNIGTDSEGNPNGGDLNGTEYETDFNKVKDFIKE